MLSHRKMLRYLVCLALSAALLCAVTVFGASALTDNGIEYIVTDHGGTSEVTVTGYSGNGTALTIPEEINGMPVTAIKLDGAAPADNAVTSLTIPKTVTSIDTASLSHLTELSHIGTDGDNTAYKTIDNVLFSKNGETLLLYPVKKGATTYVIPTGVKTIAAGAFSGNDILENITIPSGVATIKEGAFAGMDELTRAVMPYSVTAVEKNAFKDCISLSTVTLSTQLTAINEGVFSGCINLVSVIIPDSVKTIGAEAFRDCLLLTNPVLPENTASIGENAFDGCASLDSVTIFNKAAVIHADAFGDVAAVDICAYPSATAKTFATTKGYNFVPLRNLYIVNKLSRNVTIKYDGIPQSNNALLKGDGTLTVNNNENTEIEVSINSGAAVKVAANNFMTYDPGETEETVTVTIDKRVAALPVGKITLPAGVTATVKRGTETVTLKDKDDLFTGDVIKITYTGDKILKVDGSVFTSGNTVTVTDSGVVAALAPKLIKPADVTVTRNGTGLENGAELAEGDVLTITYTGGKVLKVDGVKFTSGQTRTVGTENVKITLSMTLHKPKDVTVKRKSDGAELEDGAVLDAGDVLIITYTGVKALKVNGLAFTSGREYTVGSNDVKITTALTLYNPHPEVTVIRRSDGAILYNGADIDQGEVLTINYSGVKLLRVNGEVFVPGQQYVVPATDVTISLTDELSVGILTKPEDVLVTRNSLSLWNGASLYKGDLLRISYSGPKGMSVTGAVTFVRTEAPGTYIYLVSNGSVTIELTESENPKNYAGQLYKANWTYAIRNDNYLEAGDRIYIGDKLIIGYYASAPSNMILRVNGAVFPNGGTLTVNSAGNIVITLESAGGTDTATPYYPTFPAVTYYVPEGEETDTTTASTPFDFDDDPYSPGSGLPDISIYDDDEDGDDYFDGDDPDLDDDDDDDDDDYIDDDGDDEGSYGDEDIEIDDRNIKVRLVNRLDGLTVNDPHIRTKTSFFPEDAEVVLSRTQSARDKAVAAAGQLSYTDPSIYSFDISIKNTDGDDITLSPDGYIRFIIPVPTVLTKAYGDIDVYHINEAGMPVFIPSTSYKNAAGVSVIEFTVNDFSPYMFAANVKNGSSDAYIDNSNSITPSGGGQNGNLNPHTGAVAALLIPAAVTGCVLLARSRKPSRKRADPVANAKRRARKQQR